MSRRLRPVALTVALVASLAGCASDGGNNAAPTTRPAPSTTATESTPTASSSAPPTTVELAPGAVATLDVVSGLNLPVDLAWRDGDPRLYIVGQRGVVTPVLENAAGDPVLDLGDELSDGNEQGLLGLEFHPTLPFAYVNLTDTDGNTNIVEFPVTDAADGTAQFDTAGRRTVITIEQPYPNHNGGDLMFDDAGMLLITLGDGGAANDPDRHAADPSSLLGKLLRIDPRPGADGAPYSIPADNPFVGDDRVRPEIWSLGLRNPWRIDRDPSTGELWVPDVGQAMWEEVNVVPDGRGVHFGWSAFEGTHRFNDDQSADGVTAPVFEYEHGDAGCSVSGGMAYRGDDIPSLVGWFVFSDYCSGRLVALRMVDGNAVTIELLDGLGNVSAIRRGPDGEAYVLAMDSGTVRRLSVALP